MTMLKRQPGLRERRHSCSALRTSAIDVPPIEPDRSMTKTTSAAWEDASNVGTNDSSTAPPRSPRSTTACGTSRPSAETTITRSRSIGALRCARRTRARVPSCSTSIGCDGDCDAADPPVHRQVHLERERVGHLERDRRVQDVGRRRPDAGAVLRGRVARRHGGGQREPRRGSLGSQLGHVGDRQHDLGARLHVAEARREHVGALLVQQEASVPRLQRIVVLLERLVAFLHLAHVADAVHGGLEPADGGALVQREHVDHLERHVLAVAVGLVDGDPRAEVDDVRLDANVVERDRAGACRARTVRP